MQPYSSRVGPVYLAVLFTGFCYYLCEFTSLSIWTWQGKRK